jgi:hypothetical protein
VRLRDDRLVDDADRTHHEETHVPDDVVGQGFIGDVVAIDVEAEASPLKTASVRKLDFEVELDPPFGHGLPLRPPP